MSTKFRAIAILALALVLTVTIAAPALAQDGDQAAVRIIYVVPGGPAVNVFLDNNQVFSNLTYKQVTSYFTLTAGQHTLRVVPVGSGQAPILDMSVTLDPDSYSTVAVGGQPGSIQALVMANDNTLPLPNQARVRVVHASPNAPAVDVGVQGGPTLFNNVAFPAVTDYVNVAAQPYTLQIIPAGATNIVLTVPNISLSGGAVYSIFAIGLLGGQPPLEALIVVDAPALHACSAIVATQTPGATGAAPTATGQVAAPAASGSPQATGTQGTGTPAATGSVTVTGTAGTPTPTATGTAGTPTASGTPATGTPATGTPAATVTRSVPAATSTPAATAAVTSTPAAATSTP